MLNPLNDFADEIETERTLKYANTDYWSRFKNIVEMDEITGIKNIDTTSISDSKQKYYDINGHLNNGLRKGINIIHKDNGESIKIFIK